MMDEEAIREEIVRSYYDWFNYEREWIRQIRADKTVEALTAELKKAEQMGKIVAFLTVVGQDKIVLFDDCVVVAWDRLTPKARRELREESLLRDKELDKKGVLWYSRLIAID